VALSWCPSQLERRLSCVKETRAARPGADFPVLRLVLPSGLATPHRRCSVAFTCRRQAFAHVSPPRSIVLFRAHDRRDEALAVNESTAAESRKPIVSL